MQTFQRIIIGLTRTVLCVGAVLRMEIMNCVSHNILEKKKGHKLNERNYINLKMYSLKIFFYLWIHSLLQTRTDGLHRNRASMNIGSTALSIDLYKKERN